MGSSMIVARHPAYQRLPQQRRRTDLIELELLLLPVLRIENDDLAFHRGLDHRLLTSLDLKAYQRPSTAEDTYVALQLLNGVVQLSFL